MVKKITDNVRLLGNGYFNYFLVGEKEAALVECGTSAGAAILAKQWDELENKPDVKYLVALHSHFDHSCGIPALKKLFPEALVAASKIGQKILGKDRLVKNFFTYDEVVSTNYVKSGLLDKMPDAPGVDTITVDIVLGEGNKLELGEGLSLDILDAPGHSICSIAAYLEKDQLMFVSDAAGFRTSDNTISPVFFHDYDHYINSIKKFASYPSRVVGLAHGEIPVGAEAESFYAESLKGAKKTFNWIQKQLESGVEEKIIAEILFKGSIKDGLSYYPQDMMMGSMHLLIDSVKRKLGI